jgi:peptide/nickel transport system permease protein
MTATPAARVLNVEDLLPPRPSRLRVAGRIARQNPVGVAALAIMVGLIVAALGADLIAPYGKLDLVGGRLQGPNATNLLGTDRIGRDVLSRMLYGARTSLYVGFASVAIGTAIGSFIGLLSGFVGGWVDLVLQRVMDVLMSIPALLLAMVVVSAVGPGASNAMFAIAVVFVPGGARVVRSVTLGLRARLFVEAAEASGATTMRILFRHILPTALDEILVLASLALGAAIITEAALSFLGLGAQAPEPSWGNMLSEGRLSYSVGPHMIYVPAAFISITVLSANILGDTVRDILDPKVRGAQGRAQF